MSFLKFSIFSRELAHSELTRIVTKQAGTILPETLYFSLESFSRSELKVHRGRATIARARSFLELRIFFPQEIS